MNLVSRQWRSAWKKSNFRSKSLQLPFLIIPGGRPDSLRLYSIAHRRSLRRRIEVSDPDLLGAKTCCISSNGWLLSVVDGGSVTIFNPFSLCQIKLPDVRNCVKVIKFVMSSNLSLWDSEDYSLAIGYGTRNGGSLAKWRAGDDRWSYLNEEGSDGKDEFVDVAFCRGELYVLCACSRAEELLVCIVEDYHYESDEDVGETKVRVTLGIRLVANITLTPRLEDIYLVESDGRLLIFCKEIADFDSFCNKVVESIRFRVLEVDSDNGVVVEVNNLGNRSAFLGRGQSISIDSVARYGGEANHVYFVEDVRLGPKVYSLDLESNKIKCHAGLAFCPYPLPVWIEPTYL